MKRLVVSLGFSFLLTSSSFSQGPLVIDLHQEVKNNNIEVYNREMDLVKETSHLGITLSKDVGEGVAWLKGIDFSNGTIEFDARGENVRGHSFVGIAFHGKDNATFDAIYLRPFQFLEKDETMRSHAIQFVSLPENTWRILRQKFPNKYEHSIEPSPDPNSWVKVRVVIKDSTITTYINDNKEPSLVVEKLNHIKSGALGFYVADTSGGDFANLRVTKTN